MISSAEVDDSAFNHYSYRRSVENNIIFTISIAVADPSRSLKIRRELKKEILSLLKWRLAFAAFSTRLIMKYEPFDEADDIEQLLSRRDTARKEAEQDNYGSENEDSEEHDSDNSDQEDDGSDQDVYDNSEEDEEATMVYKNSFAQTYFIFHTIFHLIC